MILNRNYLLLSSLVIIFVAGFFIFSSPEISYSQGSDCCIANGSPGCGNSSCEATVCGIDPFCCDVSWDSICAGEAIEFCEICMDGPTPTDAPKAARVPTLSAWGSIATAGILGLIGFFYLFARRKQDNTY